MGFIVFMATFISSIAIIVGIIFYFVVGFNVAKAAFEGDSVRSDNNFEKLVNKLFMPFIKIGAWLGKSTEEEE